VSAQEREVDYVALAEDEERLRWKVESESGKLVVI